MCRFFSPFFSIVPINGCMALYIAFLMSSTTIKHHLSIALYFLFYTFCSSHVKPNSTTLCTIVSIQRMLTTRKTCFFPALEIDIVSISFSLLCTMVYYIQEGASEIEHELESVCVCVCVLWVRIMLLIDFKITEMPHNSLYGELCDAIIRTLVR